ncbi:MAG: TIM barrel protein [Planctomycetota bacterium]
MRRRDFLVTPPALVGGAAFARTATGQQTEKKTQDKAGNRIRHSVMGWCFKPMKALELAQHCKSIGIEALEGVSLDDYPAVKKLGLEVSMVGSHGFAKGPIDPANHAEVERKLRSSIDAAVEFGAPNVITFTGMEREGITEETAFKNCVQCWKRVVPYAEEKGVGLVLEHLNSVDDSHPMKGHPGYWGDDIDLCLDLIRAVDSPAMKLLFDVYHVQIMHGDVIRRIRRHHEWIGHYHTAGNPGRGELDETQELNYPPIMRAILETGYTGYVAHEFIPTSDNPVASLRQAYQVCNV